MAVCLLFMTKYPTKYGSIQSSSFTENKVIWCRSMFKIVCPITLTIFDELEEYTSDNTISYQFRKHLAKQFHRTSIKSNR